jgi:hypothetical protein
MLRPFFLRLEPTGRPLFRHAVAGVQDPRNGRRRDPGMVRHILDLNLCHGDLVLKSISTLTR